MKIPKGWKKVTLIQYNDCGDWYCEGHGIMKTVELYQSKKGYLYAKNKKRYKNPDSHMRKVIDLKKGWK